MKKSHLFFLVLAPVLFTLTSFARAEDSSAEKSSCHCIFNGTKDYQLYDETKNYFGKRKVHRKWTCEYTCHVGSLTETVKGSYDLVNRGDDDGREGICEGTVYESQFNQFVMREVYTYKSSETFNPKKAKASELKQWAESQNCDRGSIFD
ncbi:MAG: hypothetical protein ACJ763_18155 [Bdellovibrionia bacterium]